MLHISVSGKQGQRSEIGTVLARKKVKHPLFSKALNSENGSYNFKQLVTWQQSTNFLATRFGGIMKQATVFSKFLSLMLLIFDLKSDTSGRT